MQQTSSSLGMLVREYSFSEVWFTLADAFVELGRLLGEEAMIPISTQQAEKKGSEI